jgi:hypothetical protein
MIAPGQAFIGTGARRDEYLMIIGLEHMQVNGQPQMRIHYVYWTSKDNVHISSTNRILADEWLTPDEDWTPLQ